MVKYNAVVAYSGKSNGHNRVRKVVVYFDVKDTSDEEIIELANEKLEKQNKQFKWNFVVIGNGKVVKRDYIDKVQ